jgi:hypothetical protein
MLDINQLVMEALSNANIDRDIRSLGWKKKLMYGLTTANLGLGTVKAIHDRSAGSIALSGGLAAVTGLMGRHFRKEQEKLEALKDKRAKKSATRYFKTGKQ